MKQTAIVLGGDGFCGWPSALRLSNSGYEVVIVDNLSRRKIDLELGCESLTPILPIGDRLAAWKELTGRGIRHVDLDVARDYDLLLALLRETRPQAIVHFAEQRAAPYSMRSSRTKRYTVENNVAATHNVLCAVAESRQDIHVVHLGTMGVYGYDTSGMKIPEGYLAVRISGENDRRESVEIQREIMYPADPGSIYHMTKTLDALLFYYYNKNDQVRVTDLHQGVVWGTTTPECSMDERLVNRFDYDGEYGTVLNRFLVEAAVGHPLTVHGTGGQTRAFIHIRDTVRCIELALQNPPGGQERVKIFNQVTETHTIRNLAQRVSKLTGARVEYVDNPRNEPPQNELYVDNSRFLELGLEPTSLSDGLLAEVKDIAQKYAHRCDRDKIRARTRWSHGLQEALRRAS